MVPNTLKLPLLQLKFEVRSLIAREPMLSLLHFPIIWWAQYKAREHIDIRECTIGDHTEFVIDGFQGSGNSFATVAFKRSQKSPVMLAHHLHSPAQIIKAVNMGLPVLITLRKPKGAVVSLTSRWPYVRLNQAIRSYTRFYEKIEPYADRCVISLFEHTTSQLDEVIGAVNKRYGTNFDIFEHTEANVNTIRNPERLTSDVEERRKRTKKMHRAMLDDPMYAEDLQRAQSVYERMAAHSLQPTVRT